MATPIAHKGVTAGAKAQAMTMIDLLTKPELVKMAWNYFRDVQTKELKVPAAPAPAGQTGHRTEPRADGKVSRRDAQVLLRSVEVQDLPRAARDHVSDGEEVEARAHMRLGDQELRVAPRFARQVGGQICKHKQPGRPAIACVYGSAPNRSLAGGRRRDPLVIVLNAPLLLIP